MFTGRAVVSRQGCRRNVQCPADRPKVLRQTLEAHDVMDVGERVFFAVIQALIVCDRYSFRNNFPEFYPVPVFRTLRRREIIREHPVPRISHSSELIKIAKLLASECIMIFAERRVFFNVVVWTAQS